MRILNHRYSINKKGIWRTKVPKSNKKNVKVGHLDGLSNIQRQVWFSKFGGAVGIGVYKNLWVAGRCVNMISETAANLPYMVQDENGKHVEDESFKKYILNPNELDTGAELREQFFSYYLLDGNGYHLKLEGRDTDYFTLQSQGMRIIKSNDIIEPILGYKYTENGKTKTFSTDDILHMRSFNTSDRTDGIPRLTAAAHEVGFLDLTDEYQNNLYRNQATPSGVLSTEDIMEQAEFDLLRKRFKDQQAGVENAGETLILEKGLNYKSIAFKPTDLDLIRSQSMTESAIATLYGVPIELLGHLAEKKNRANYKEARMAFYIETVLPLTKKYVNMINKDLFPDMKKRVVVNLTEIPELRPTATELKDEYWTNPNQKLTQQGKPVSTDPLMDRFYFPGGLRELSELSIEEDNNKR